MKYPIGTRVRFNYGPDMPDDEPVSGCGTVVGRGNLYPYQVTEDNGTEHFCHEDELTPEPERTTP